jgi:hypothetical protein
MDVAAWGRCDCGAANSRGTHEKELMLQSPNRSRSATAIYTINHPETAPASKNRDMATEIV